MTQGWLLIDDASEYSSNFHNLIRKSLLCSKINAYGVDFSFIF